MQAQGLIAWFLPPGSAGGADDRRRRKLVAVLLVVISVATVTLLSHLLQGAWRMSIGNAVAVGVAIWGLFALRQGARVAVVTPVVLLLGVLSSALLGIGGGRDGVISVFWMSLAPLIAMATGGRRAGWVTLGFTVVIAGATIVAIDQQWLPELVQVERWVGTRIASMCGAFLTVFLLTRAYETETDAIIRTLEAKNRALLEARSEADRANSAKSEFLATISHEIRTPLNGVTGMATLLADEGDPVRVREGLKVIQQSADTLLAVINDVLDFSKIESNELVLERVPVSLAEELRWVVDLLQNRAAERQNELELTLSNDVPRWISGDPTRLRQVAMNLISNSVKFTEGGRVAVKLSAKPGFVTLEVADTGIGMSAQAQERMFRPFVQADASTTRRFGGTGLGLVITRRLVRAMGGEIAMASVEGKGSAFTVTLPVEVSEGPRAALPITRANVQRSVLLVEDNFVNQVVASRLIEKLGHKVAVAGDGLAALELMRTARFDVVFMDCHMPVMDGFDATRELRRRGVTVPIFALTAAVTTEDRDRCLAAGMNGVLSKPLRVERLAEVLDR